MSVMQGGQKAGEKKFRVFQAFQSHIYTFSEVIARKSICNNSDVKIGFFPKLAAGWPKPGFRSGFPLLIKLTLIFDQVISD